MHKNALTKICNDCCSNYKSFSKKWKLNHQNDKLFIFCVQSKLESTNRTLDLNELIPDYSFYCGERWFVIYSIAKLGRMSRTTYQNFNFRNYTLLIGLYWYHIFTNGIIKSRWYNILR
ncbi:hypothetical protein [Spiroplasma endosymbiont of Stenodema calcarata]|uniref:hypothetical protein n=1 Tax=Spiroplasma endosymbiont of Stenodema calcarata TaxID=3139328 RepID=UPI003CCB3E19